MTTRLPVVLDNLRIATPCQAEWDDMRGDERVRFCGTCEKNVYNLSAMTREDAEALVRQKEGRLCVRLFRRQDGTVLTSDCPDGVLRLKRRQRLWASLSGAAASLALLLGLAGRARADLSVRNAQSTQKHTPTASTASAPSLTALLGKLVRLPDPEAARPKKPIEVKGEPAMPLMGDVAPEPAPKVR